MQEVVSSVKRVTDIMGEVTASSIEQSSGIEQVNQAIIQMDQMTQQNAALVEQAAAAADALKSRAMGLQSMVSMFKLTPGSGAAPFAPDVTTVAPSPRWTPPAAQAPAFKPMVQPLKRPTFQSAAPLQTNPADAGEHAWNRALSENLKSGDWEAF
jgi:methyl-accepting chemotaxis protein